ncbi:unnamed protein product [Effrenium voratum]|nr:unnamed protein product [Effrenium voratum]
MSSDCDMDMVLQNESLATTRFSSIASAASSPPRLDRLVASSASEDLDSRDRWDEDAASCAICNTLLGRRRLRPRHHCRICGRCVCASCSPSMVAMPGCKDLQRACSPCLTIAARRAVTGNLHRPLCTIFGVQELQHPQSNHFGPAQRGPEHSYPSRLATGHTCSPRLPAPAAGAAGPALAMESFKDLVEKLTAAHEREVASAREEATKLRREVEDLQKQLEAVQGRKQTTSFEIDETALIHVKPASKGSQGGLVSVLKSDRTSRNSLCSENRQMRLQLQDMDSAGCETGATPPHPTPRNSTSEQAVSLPTPGSTNSGNGLMAPSSPPSSHLRVSFGNLVPGGGASKPGPGRPVLPWPPAARRNSAMVSPQNMARRRQSAAMALNGRRGTTVGIGLGLQDVKLLPVWSKNPVSEQPARVTPRHMSANKDQDGDTDSVVEGGVAVDTGGPLITCVARLVSNPSSPKRIAYEIFGLLLIIYDLIWLPMTVFEPSDSNFNIIMGLLSSIYWTCDMPMSFLVGYAVQDKGIIEMRLRKIAWNYCRSWLVLDLAIVTIDWTLNLLEWTNSESIAPGEGISFFRIGKAVRFLRLLRLLRLLKAHGRFNELLEHVQSEFSVIVIGILKLIAFILLLNHLVACVWYWIGTMGSAEGRSNWLSQSDVSGSNTAYRYFTSLHWSLTQFTPASMEVTPKNELERLFNVVVIMSAMVIFSTFISAITNAMNQLRNLNSERNEQASLLRRYMQQNNVSAPLKARVLQSIKALSQTRSRVHELDVAALRLLPLSLRHDLSQEVYAPHVGVHPFFYVCNACFSMQSRKIYSTCLAEKSLSTSMELITSGENAQSMYFVVGGILDYVADERDEKDPPIALEAGAWLVEAALWVKWQHNGTANTGAGCELIAVDAGGLQNILKDERPVRQYANMFWKYFSDNPDTLTDVWCDEEVLFDWATRAMGQAETYYGDVIPAEPVSQNTNSKFFQFLNSQRRLSSGFVGRRFSDDSLGAILPGEVPAVLQEEGGSVNADDDDSSSSSGLTDSE